MSMAFFRPRILTYFGGFSVELHNNFYESIAWYHMGLPPKSFYDDIAKIL